MIIVSFAIGWCMSLQINWKDANIFVYYVHCTAFFVVWKNSSIWTKRSEQFIWMNEWILSAIEILVDFVTWLEEKFSIWWTQFYFSTEEMMFPSLVSPSFVETNVVETAMKSVKFATCSRPKTYTILKIMWHSGIVGNLLRFLFFSLEYNTTG